MNINEVEFFKTRTIPLLEVHERLQDLFKQKLNFATPEEYEEYQGGVPQLVESRGLNITIHRYPSGGIIVTSHKTIEDFGSNTVLLPSGKVVEIAGILDRKNHTVKHVKPKA